MPSCPPEQPPTTSRDLVCAVCGTGSWVEIERRSTGPRGTGTRWGCQQCGAHVVLPDDDERA